MMQEQKLAPKTRYLLEKSEEIYLDLLGYKPEKTRLIEIRGSRWDSFCKEINIHGKVGGFYLSRNQTAYIPQENSLSFFHEYFGHGIYYEKNKLGKKMLELEKILLNEEKAEFQGKEFNLKNIQEFRRKSKTFGLMKDLKTKEIANQELFAIFVEYLLSHKFNLEQEFRKKY